LSLRILLLVFALLSPTAAHAAEKPTLDVNYSVKEGAVYIDCRLHNFSFVRDDENKGVLKITIDDKKTIFIEQAAFVIRGLKGGEHKVQIEVMKNEKNSYGVEKEISFQVEEEKEQEPITE
jgi:hypothetical protein